MPWEVNDIAYGAPGVSIDEKTGLFRSPEEWWREFRFKGGGFREWWRDLQWEKGPFLQTS